MAQDEIDGAAEAPEAAEAAEALCLVGGIALLVLGVGLIMTHSAVRKSVALGLSGLLPDLKDRLPDLSVLGSDVQRYMKLRSM